MRYGIILWYYINKEKSLSRVFYINKLYRGEIHDENVRTCKR